MPTAADIVSVLQASNIPIHLLGLIRVGKIMSFPTKKIAVDPKGEPAFFFWSYRTPFECREFPFYVALRSSRGGLMEKGGIAFDIDRFEDSAWTRLLTKSIPPTPPSEADGDAASASETELTPFVHADFRFVCHDAKNPSGVILVAPRPYHGVQGYPMCTLHLVTLPFPPTVLSLR